VVPDPAARRPRVGITVLVSTLVVAVLTLAAVVWVVTRPDSTAEAPTVPPSPSATMVDPNCWTATIYGECPAFDASAVSYSVFRGYKDDDIQVMCYPGQPPGDEPGSAEPERMAYCGWDDAGIWVYITQFVDIDTMVTYYEDQGLVQTSDAPPFAKGPDGPVFFHVHDDGVEHATYCFATLPMCLDAFGTEDTPIPMSTRYFSAISSEDAQRIVDYLAEQ
jgi:hypothetical protein